MTTKRTDRLRELNNWCHYCTTETETLLFPNACSSNQETIMSAIRYCPAHKIMAENQLIKEKIHRKASV